MNNQEIIRKWITLAQFFMNWVSGINVLIENEGLVENTIEELSENHLEMLFVFGDQFDALPTPQSLNTMRPFIKTITQYVGDAVKEGNVSKAAGILCAIEDTSPLIMKKLIVLAQEINPNANVFYASSHIDLDGGEDGHAAMFRKLSTQSDISYASEIWMNVIREVGLKLE